jgi:hypothetical protein
VQRSESSAHDQDDTAQRPATRMRNKNFYHSAASGAISKRSWHGPQLQISTSERPRASSLPLENAATLDTVI